MKKKKRNTVYYEDKELIDDADWIEVAWDSTQSEEYDESAS